jgi:hypothetical protein
MVNKRRTKKYNRRKSLRGSLRRSLKRKNSKRKSRKIVRKNKKRTRKIKQRGGSGESESTDSPMPVKASEFIMGDVNVSRLINRVNPAILQIDFNGDNFNRSEQKTLQGFGDKVGDLLVLGMKDHGLFRTFNFKTEYKGEVYSSADYNRITVVFKSGEGLIYKVFECGNGVVAVKGAERVEHMDLDICRLYIKNSDGSLDIFRIYLSRQYKSKFIEDVNRMYQEEAPTTSHTLNCKLKGYKTKTGKGTVRSVTLDSGEKFLMMNPSIDASDFFLRAQINDGQTIEFKTDEIQTFDWAAGRRGDNFGNPGLRITLKSSKTIDHDEVTDIKFTFEEPHEFVKLFMVEKGKGILAKRGWGKTGADADADADGRAGADAEPEPEPDGGS